jgi:hypothetical protein
MKMNLKVKMLIGATLCALALSASASNYCAIGYAKDNHWIGLVCLAESTVTGGGGNTGVWSVMTPGMMVKSSKNDCDENSMVYRVGGIPTGRQLQEQYEKDYTIFARSNNSKVCVGLRS